MILQRYLLEDNSRGSYFGNPTFKFGAEFDWLFQGRDIGLVKKPERGENTFIDDFLTAEERLIIALGGEAPRIIRESLPGRYLLTSSIKLDKEELREIECLARLIQSQEPTHVYLSSLCRGGASPDVLTFSRKAPPEELYTIGRVMPVAIVAEEDVLAPARRR